MRLVQNTQAGTEGVAIVSRSGLPGSYITYKPYPAQHPKLHVVNSWNHILITASYIRIEGFEVEGDAKNITVKDEESEYDSTIANGKVNWSSPTTRKLNTNGISVRPDSDMTKYGLNTYIIPNHVEIINNNVHDVPGGGIYTDEADYITIEGNVVHDTAIGMFANSGISIFHNHNTDEENTSYKNVIRNNISYHNTPYVKWVLNGKWSDGNGIIIDDTKCTQNMKTDRYIEYTGRTLVDNNIAYENSGSGIHAFSCDNVDVINNTAYNNNSEHLNWGQIFAQNSNNVRVVNNIAYAKTGNIVTLNYDSVNKNVIYS
ncbi:right-handed parallel beta-helix repeat-containing protein [Clostridium vincentii]|uniref:Uncharacterized protein n=1 Tax=Clostridium vincentii TaxID=52704 RepID=A0A2T0B722_9CLOT|nr:right-handed parallel beta-helix repeat-containing protein [Clostridium vincentii]PRR79613.1 hypothetical protein CLVI_32970 [Clostridium vincentii]